MIRKARGTVHGELRGFGRRALVYKLGDYVI